MIKAVEIVYIYNSCFKINVGEKTLVFDYASGNLGSLSKDPSNTYFLVSHSHKDHFSKRILTRLDSDKFNYIVSSDLLDLEYKDNIIVIGKDEKKIDWKKKLFQDNVKLIKENQVKQFKDLSVRTFSSTDKGVSFLVEMDQIRFFHAGDLNLWVWPEDSQEEKDKMFSDFMKEIDKISKFGVDIAFFPLDPRLGDMYAEGMKIFLDEVKPSLVFPMHFRDDHSKMVRFVLDHPEYKEIYKPIFNENQMFYVNFKQE